eukprot:5421784-Prymnesium_polylepis.1
MSAASCARSSLLPQLRAAVCGHTITNCFACAEVAAIAGGEPSMRVRALSSSPRARAPCRK